LRLLLDTHIWYWLVTDVGRIGKRAIRELTNSGNELWLSPISTWELLTLNAKGRVRLSGDPEFWLARAIRGMQEAPLTHEIAAAAVQIPMHRDPADRFLAATAQILDMTLVTADEKLLGLGTIQTLANR
jgi:PIN domain nuclease of toxin-antitoxin system